MVLEYSEPYAVTGVWYYVYEGYEFHANQLHVGDLRLPRGEQLALRRRPRLRIVP